MSGAALYLVFIIPALAIVGFGVWIGATRWADAHPRDDSPAEPLATKVRGGSFEGGGGRQVMPRRDATPPEAAAYEDKRS